MLDVIFERLEQRIFTQGTTVIREGLPVSRMFFVLKGELESSTMGGGRMKHRRSVRLKNGDFFGEELLILYLEQSQSQRDKEKEKKKGSRRISSANEEEGDEIDPEVFPRSENTIVCLGPVEGFVLEAADLEFVCKQFHKSLNRPAVQHALKYSTAISTLSLFVILCFSFTCRFSCLIVVSGFSGFFFGFCREKIEGFFLSCGAHTCVECGMQPMLVSPAHACGHHVAVVVQEEVAGAVGHQFGTRVLGAHAGVDGEPHEERVAKEEGEQERESPNHHIQKVALHRGMGSTSQVVWGECEIRFATSGSRAGCLNMDEGWQWGKLPHCHLFVRIEISIYVIATQLLFSHSIVLLTHNKA